MAKMDDMEVSGNEAATTSRQQQQQVSSSSSSTLKKFRFRNYVPHDTTLLSMTMPAVTTETMDAERMSATTTGEYNGDSAITSISTKSKNSKNDLSASELLRQEIESVVHEVEQQQNERGGDPAAAIAPKKPNWDLKNQVADRLARLQRRTQRAIVDILREKMAQEHEEQEEEEEEGTSR